MENSHAQRQSEETLEEVQGQEGRLLMVPFDVEGDDAKHAGSPLKAFHFSCLQLPTRIYRVVDKSLRDAFYRLVADDPAWHRGAFHHHDLDGDAMFGEPKYPFRAHWNTGSRARRYIFHHPV